MKKVLIVFVMLPLLVGCYAGSGGIPLFNSYGYNYTPKSVVVQKGDTLFSLSKKYEVPLKGIIDKNSLKQPYNLQVGQVLALPVSNKHVVVKGETLYSIAKKYDTDLNRLGKLNNLKAPYALNVGQVLELPANTVKKQNSSSGGFSKFSFSKTKISNLYFARVLAIIDPITPAPIIIISNIFSKSSFSKSPIIVSNSSISVIVKNSCKITI